MLTQLTIPKKINVGFQDRQGTYTGKLAYVIYTDAKGVLRKEKSWNGWRDQKISPKEFDNVPTSGFVLNKKVGETRWGWNPRKAWVRVYDSRGFEFEISVANLVFILEEVTSTRGKGLEGEFVYAWDGAELVLLPVCSQEYKSSATHTELQGKKITKSDMQEGCLYLNKDNEEVMYLGRHEFWDLSEYSFSNHGHKEIEHSKQHVFVSTDGKSTYWPQPGFTKLANKLSAEPLTSFADEYEKFKKSGHSSAPITLVGMPTKFDLESEYYNWLEKPCFIKKENLFYPAILEEETQGDLFHLYTKDRPISLIDEKVFFAEPETYGFHKQHPQQLTKEQAVAVEFYEVCLKNENGGLLTLKEDYGNFDEDEDDY